ncbi:MAG TPA: IS5 family transposase [Terriglobia bacterium]|nr:IS5 family transposase [Terriglobia bacterium]
MKQQTLGGFEKYTKTTRRAKFLAEMDRLVPWKELGEAIEPIYPKGGGETGGRPPVLLEKMLRIYFLQLWFNLSDPAVEEALYDSASMRGFVGIDLGTEPVPDETTACKFRHLLERNGMGKRLLKAMNTYLRENGIKVGNGTIVDATIISAPSSTKNQDKQRDPEMHQTAKGKQWYFGMKAHIGVDSKSKIIHTIKASAANIADSMALPHLLHGKETRVWGDQAYRGQRAAIRKVAPRARDFTNQRYRWGKRVDERIKAINRTKSSVRAKVEHTIGVIKRVFGFQKVRYRGLAKNLHRLEVSAALANLFLVRKRLLHA